MRQKIRIFDSVYIRRSEYIWPKNDCLNIFCVVFNKMVSFVPEVVSPFDSIIASISLAPDLRDKVFFNQLLFSNAANEKRAFDLDDDVYAEYVEQLLTELHKNPDDDLQKFLDDAEDRKLEMDVNEYYEW